MEIRNYQKEAVQANPHGIKSYKLYDKDFGVIMHLVLEKNERLKEHITPVDVVFYVLEGEPTILVGEKKIKAGPDDLIESPKNIVHCLYNETDSRVRVLVMKLPKPTAKTIMVQQS
jgi:quercetin dioxygenase-like cupin family protein